MKTATTTVTIELPNDQAMALAQLCKRISFKECRANAIDGDEAYVMLDAIAKLQRALAESGYSPR